MDDNFYDVLDLNIGREVELFGRVFKIYDCDRFTRNYLNRLGLQVPDPIPCPEDLYLKEREKAKDALHAKKPSHSKHDLANFLLYDRKILKFNAYWDDRENEYGFLHNLIVYYYLADGTIEIKDVLPPNSGSDGNSTLAKRLKLPKIYKGLPGPGANSNITLLNVLGANTQGGRFLPDSLDCGQEKVEYYTDKDLTIGGVINCYGRKIVLVDCDPFTKEYYRTKYGIDEFIPAERPEENAKGYLNLNK